MKSALNRSVLAFAAIAFVAGAGQVNAQQKPLHSYQSGNKEFWTHPPDDWFLGDETEAPEGPGAAVRSADRRIGRRTGDDDEEDQAAAGLQDRSLRLGRAGGAADGLGRQGHAVRRLVRPRQRLCHHRQGRQERGQDHHQGPERDADRPRLQGRRALRHRRQQADQVRQRRSQSRQARRRQGGV